MPFGLNESQLNAITDLLSRNGRIEEAVVFGSRAKGTHRPGSDMDIALKGSGLNLDDVLNLSIALDELWLPIRFDLVIYNRITEPALRDHIDRIGKVLWPKPASV
ncbi:nucleotidyltransferase domain-containing protein [Larkinella terrae]|uniref:Nucleotidyltransferase domain-containing protein n=1 Tax=Larkinella terrae TaxID=2025311 RepID=A0A7K0ESU2_9BACT|nr:nucleotidyltransferase domain-containing protein [Larkinella terrae]MRS64883.1 nucleotidyltransferase domain-containing protein [Larkinella terrae]